jgi:hypothetical protein
MRTIALSEAALALVLLHIERADSAEGGNEAAAPAERANPQAEW